MYVHIQSFRFSTLISNDLHTDVRTVVTVVVCIRSRRKPRWESPPHSTPRPVSHRGSPCPRARPPAGARRRGRYSR